MKHIVNLSTFASITHDTTEIWVKLSNISKINGLNIVALRNFYVTLDDVVEVIFTIRTSGNKDVLVTDSGGGTSQLTFADFSKYCYADILEFIDANITYRNTESETILSPIVYETEKTPLELYRLNCKRNKINKKFSTNDLINVGIIYGDFNNVVALKNPVIDVEGFNITETYNYVYIVSLNRFYFVNSVDLVTDKTTRISLSEDVLKSHATLIKLQSALVTRSEEKGYQYTIVDDRYPLESVKTVEYITPTHTASGTNLENITIDTQIPSNISDQKRNFIVAVLPPPREDFTDVDAPTGTLLPTISWSASPSATLYLCKLHELREYLNGLYWQGEYVTYLNSIILLPFDLSNAYDQTYTTNFNVGGNGVVCDDGEIHDGTIPSGVHVLQVPRVTYRTSPYLILADIEFPSAPHWYDREPYTVYEMYIPFVGWIQLDIENVRSCRLLVYYTLDYSTGNATVYVYNVTRQQVIYTTSCQLGSKLSVSSTNNSDLARERENIELNSLMSALTSGVSILGGAVTESPKMFVGGLVSAGKGIASQVNAERMLVQRGHVTYGSGESGYHGIMDVQLRKTYYKPVLSSSNETNIYNKQQGKPYNNYVAFGTLADGYYIEVGDIQFDPKGYDIYNEEINEIVTLLQNGVIL